MTTLRMYLVEHFLSPPLNKILTPEIDVFHWIGIFELVSRHFYLFKQKLL